MNDQTRRNGSEEDDYSSYDYTQHAANGTEFTQASSSGYRDSEPPGWQSSSYPQETVPYQPTLHAMPTRRANNFNWGVLVIAIVLFGGTVLLSLGAFVVLRIANADRLTPAATEVAAAPAITVTPAPTATVGIQIQPWDGKKRLTVLLMGIDKRPGEKGTAFRTDSMIIVSIDPTTRSVGILSVPRDLYIDIPRDTIVKNSYGLQRINSAYVIGEVVRAGYGPQLAMQTVQYNLGMRINNYVVFEFGTVINAVDDIGGIDIDVVTAISDPQYPNMYYGFDPVYIPAGKIHMNGDLALKFARTRHNSSDFERAKRQQQVVLAIRDKILNLNMAPKLVAEAPQLWAQLSTTTKSDLTFDQLLRLGVYLKDVPKENIHQGVLDTNYVSPIMWQGAAVLIPERAKIGPLLIKVFGANYN